MQIVNQPVRKKDAMQLVTGQPVYMDDMIPEDCLIVKLLRSPHANAVVQEIQTDKAMKVPESYHPSVHGGHLLSYHLRSVSDVKENRMARYVHFSNNTDLQ